MVASSLVVVLVVHVLAVAAVEDEGDSPVSIDIYSPLPLAATLERVKPETRGIEVSSIGRGV